MIPCFSLGILLYADVCIQNNLCHELCYDMFVHCLGLDAIIKAQMSRNMQDKIVCTSKTCQFDSMLDL
jgi:hypothetical protein